MAELLDHGLAPRYRFGRPRVTGANVSSFAPRPFPAASVRPGGSTVENNFLDGVDLQNLGSSF